MVHQGAIESNLAAIRGAEELRKVMAHDLQKFRQATKFDLKELELRLTVKLGAVMVGGLVVTMVLLKLKII